MSHFKSFLAAARRFRRATNGISSMHGRKRLSFDFLEDRVTPAITLTGLTPGGSLIYQGSEAGTIAAPAAVNTHTVSLDPNQTLSVRVTPAAGLSIGVSVEDPLGGVLATGSAAAGQPVLISSAAVGSSGSYVVRVTGQASGTGAYTVEATANAALEAEATGAATNDTTATAQSLTTAFSVIASPASQAAVIGGISGGSDVSDYYAFNLTTGQRVSLGLVKTSVGASLSLSLLNPAEVAVGLGVAGAQNLDQTVTDFTATSAGTYYAKVTGSGSYRLVVTREAGFDRESNSTLALAQVLSSSGYSIGKIDSVSATTAYAAASVATDFLDISGTGNRVTDFSSTDDSYHALTSANLGTFQFPFYGTTYNSMYLSTNGLIKFGASGASDYNNGDLSSAPTEAAIAVLWDDLQVAMTGGQDCYWQLVGSGANQQLVILWKNISHLSTSYQYSIEAVLSQDGTIQFNYDSRVISSVINDSSAGIKAAGTSNPQRLLVLNGPSQPLGTLVGPSTSVRISPADGADFYRFSVNAGDVLSFSTSTPFDSPLQPVNSLDPTITLYNPAGTQVDFNDNGAPDGRNAILTHPATATGTYTVRVGAAGTTSGEYVLSVSGNTGPSLSNAPTITSDGGAATATKNVAENSTAVTQVTATDLDPGTTLTYSKGGGADQAFFSINPTTGVLTFQSPPDAEAPADANHDNVYEIIVVVSDGSLTDNQVLSVVVTDVSEFPPIINGGDTASVSVSENSSFVTTVQATDADRSGSASVVYSIDPTTGGADRTRFFVNSSTGQLFFSSTPNFEQPADVGADNHYEVIVRAFDGTYDDFQTITVTVNDVNEAPFPSLSSTTVLENVSLQTVVGTISAPDPEGTPVTLSLVSGFGSDDNAAFTISGNQLLTAAPVDREAKGLYRIRLRATDQTLQASDAIYTITITDVAEAPSQIGQRIDIANGGFESSPDFTGWTLANGPLGGSSAVVRSGGATEGSAFAQLFVSGSVTSLTTGYGQILRTETFTALAGDQFTADVRAIVSSDWAAPRATLYQSNGTPVATFWSPLFASDSGWMAALATIPGNGDFYVEFQAGSYDASGNGFVSAYLNIDNARVIRALGSVGEHQPIGTTVAPLTAFDPESSQGLAFALSPGGTDNASFTVSGGLLQTAAVFDAAVRNSYAIQLQATASGQTGVQPATIAIIDAPEAPVIDSNGGGATASFNVAENLIGAATTVAAHDPDAGTNIVYSIDPGGDAVRFSINPATGALTFASPPNYEIPVDSDADNVYVVTVRASDGVLFDSQTLTITVTNANDNPVVTSNGGLSSASFSVAENTPLATTVTATDEDLPAQTITYSKSGLDAARFSIDPNSGALTFVSGPNFEAPTDNGGNNVYDLVVTATDSQGGNSSQTLHITVTNVNEFDPVLVGLAASINHAENTAAVVDVDATDADTGSILTFSLGGADSAQFFVSSSTGLISFVSGAGNFEFPTDAGANNVYNIIVTVSDGTRTASQAVAVTVTDINDAPAITNDGALDNVGLSLPEEVTSLVTTVLVIDEDLPTQTLNYSLAGLDQSAFNLNTATGALTFIAPPDYEAPADSDQNNVYQVIVQVNDGHGGSDSQTITITILNTNDAPHFTGSATLSVSENSAAAGTITALDDDLNSLTFSLGTAGDSGLYSINSSSGLLSFNTAPNLEASQDADHDNNYLVTVLVTDGISTPVSRVYTVAVTDVNEFVPSITSNGGGSSASFSIAENTVYATTVTATDGDIFETLTYSIVGGADLGKFDIDASAGLLTFKSPPNFENAADADHNNVYEVTVQVSDGVNIDTQTLSIGVQNINEAPVITSNGGGDNASVNIPENTTAVATAAATDQDAPAQTLTYSIVLPANGGGADAARFTIDPNSGALSFVSAPDFENPTDVGANNIYDVTIKVTDNGSPAASDTQNITVAVTDVNENVSTTTTVTPTPASPVLQGTSVTFMATITGNPSAGTITFYAGPGLTNPIGSPVNVVSGTATSSATTTLPSGSLTITAVYSGGRVFAPSQGTTPFVVNAITTTTVVSTPASPITQGTSITFNATVTGNPSIGTVTFYAGPGLTNQIGSPVAIVNGSATSAATTSLAVGSYTITAVYNGGTGFASSQGTTSLVVNRAPFVVTNLLNSGAGSLRQAMTDAGAAAGADTITFASGLTGTITLASSLPTIADNLTIIGPGSANLIIDANNNLSVSRMFYVTDASSGTVKTVSMSGLTLKGTRSGTFGALENLENLTLTDISFVNNNASPLVNSGGSLTYTNGSIINNPYSAGTIAIYSGPVALSGLTITGNGSGSGNGVIATSSGVTVSISDSTISSNNTLGIDLQPTATLTVIRTTISSNTFNGISSYGNLSIEDSTISGNQRTALNIGGGTLTFRNSTISGNASNDRGGGIFLSSGTTATISNSTISGNTAVNTGGGIYFLNSGSTLTLTNVTISGNTANNSSGGGIYSSGTNTLRAINTIISGNTASTNPDLAGTTVASGSNNLIGSATVDLRALDNNGGPTQTRALGATSSAINPVGGSPLTTIATDSGNTMTVAAAAFLQFGQLYRVGSEIIKIVSISGTTLTVLRAQGGTTQVAQTSGTAVNLAYDQRGAGYPRLAGTSIDIGSFELQPPTVTGILPVIGPTTGGTLISILGSNFANITSVIVDGVALAGASYSVVSTTQITATVPSHAAGAVDVQVVNAGGTGSLAGTADFTYAKPSVAQVQVNGGPNITLSGANTTASVQGQNSVVRQIKVTFNQAVTVASDAFTITPRTSNVTINGGAAPSTMAVSTSVTPLSPSEYLVTFSGAGTHNGIINSGVYDLTTIASKVTANGDAMPVDRVDSFFAIFGTIDSNNSYTSGTIGNGGSHAFVDPGSLFQFSDAFGSSATIAGPPAYRVVFDSNLDGFIDPGDLFAFSDSFGIDWVF